MSGAVAIGIDVGGTKCLAGAIGADGTVSDRRRIQSPGRDPDRLIGALVGLVTDLGGDLPVGVGIAGLVDRAGVVRYGPNVAIRDLPVLERLGAALDLPVTVANDGTVAAVGEHRAGAARGHDDVVMVTLGTGVGGGLVVGGQPVLGAASLAGELGHVAVEAGGRLCPCGRQGCIEAYASGTAIGLRARTLLETTDVDSSLRAVEPLDGKAVSIAARADDRFAIEVLEEAGRWLGVALGSLVNALDPGIVLVGGGAGPETGPWLLPAARAAMAAQVMGADHRAIPELVPAALGDDAGIVGAALLALDRTAERT